MEYEHASDIICQWVIMHMDRRDATVSCDPAFSTRELITKDLSKRELKQITYLRLAFCLPGTSASWSLGSNITYVCDNEPTSTSSDLRPPSAKFRDESRAGREVHSSEDIVDLTDSWRS